MSTWKKVHVEDADTKHGTITAALTDNTSDVTGEASVELVTVDGTGSGAQLLKRRTFTFGDNAFNSTTFLTGNQTITVSGDASGSGTTSIDLTLGTDAITTKTALTAAPDGTNDYILIYDADADQLKRINRSNFVSGLGSMSSFDVAVGATSVQVDDSETITFANGTGAAFTIDGTGGVPTITVSSVDNQIVHDDLDGFVDNEHINHANVTLTAGNGLTGGGDITTSRTFNIGAGDLIDVSADAVSVDLTEATLATIASGDYIVFLDGGASGTHAKGSINDVAALFAGDGLTANSGVLSVDTITLGTDTSGDYVANVVGTTNEVSVSGSAGGTYTVGLPDDVIITNDLTVGGDLNITGTINQTSVTELNVTDKTIRVANGASAGGSANLAGLVVDSSGLSTHANDSAILFYESGAAFFEWKMTKSEGATPNDAAWVAGMVTAANYSTLDTLTPGVGTFGMVGGDLYVQTA